MSRLATIQMVRVVLCTVQLGLQEWLMKRALFVNALPSISMRSVNSKIYTFPSANRLALSSLVILSPVYRIMRLPALIGFAVKSPRPAIADGPTHSSIFTGYFPFLRDWNIPSKERHPQREAAPP